MYSMKRGAKVMIAFAVAVISLIAGGWSEGSGLSVFGNAWGKGGLKDEDAALTVNVKRPVSTDNSAQFKEHDTVIKIDIGKGGVVFNGRSMSFKMLDDNIKKFAMHPKGCVVLVRCTLDSPHGFLIRVLDICHKYKMPPPCIFSM